MKGFFISGFSAEINVLLQSDSTTRLILSCLCTINIKRTTLGTQSADRMMPQIFQLAT